MARCPFASWRPLGDPEPTIVPTQFIFHTMVGTLPGTDSLFRNRSSLESHFGLGGPWEGASFDGVLWQWVDTSRQADANGAANARAISVETSDGGDPMRPWTPKQVDTLVRLGRWARVTHNIPPRICPKWDASGFGWHALFDPWNPNNHSCPAATRIRQLKEVVLPRIFAPTEGEDDMTPEQAAQLDAIYNVLFKGHVPAGNPIDNLYVNANNVHKALVVPGTTTAEEAFDMLFNRVRSIAGAVGADPDAETVVAAIERAKDEILDALALPPA